MSIRVGILADDLTGGMNIGIEFAQAGYRTLLIEQNQKWVDADVLIVDTGTRNTPPKQAYTANYGAAHGLHKLAPELILKKIDSLMRGNIGQEIDAIMDALGYDRCLLTPASPKLNRRVIGGYILVDDHPLVEQQPDLDPLGTAATSQVMQLLSQQSKRAITHLDIDTIRQGETAIAAALGYANDTILVIDSMTQHDLSRVVQVAYQQGIAFFAGSYGMGEAVCHVLRARSKSSVLVVVGSLSAAAQRQVDYLKGHIACALIQPEYDVSFIEQGPQAFAAPYAEALQNRSRTAAVSIVQIAAPRSVVESLRHVSTTRGHNLSNLNERIQRLAQSIVGPVLGSFDGFVATGGSTASSLLELLDTDGLQLEASEVISGVAFARIMGGIFHNRPFVIKPGSHGADDALYKLVLAVQRGIKRDGHVEAQHHA